MQRARQHQANADASSIMPVPLTDECCASLQKASLGNTAGGAALPSSFCLLEQHAGLP